MMNNLWLYVAVAVVFLLGYLRFRKQLRRIFRPECENEDECRCRVVMRRQQILHDSINSRLPATESQH